MSLSQSPRNISPPPPAPHLQPPKSNSHRFVVVVVSFSLFLSSPFQSSLIYPSSIHPIHHSPLFYIQTHTPTPSIHPSSNHISKTKRLPASSALTYLAPVPAAALPRSALPADRPRPTLQYPPHPSHNPCPLVVNHSHPHTHYSTTPTPPTVVCACDKRSAPCRDASLRIISSSDTHHDLPRLVRTNVPWLAPV